MTGALYSLKQPSKREVLDAKYSLGSEMLVQPYYEGANLVAVHIELHGPISRIPSLKNSKMPGKNFMNNDTRSRLRVMDRLYAKACQQIGVTPPTFGDSEVFALVVCGKRPTRFDKDNCATTVQDWLEPTIKKVGKKGAPRGWGVGVVNNDKQITTLAFNSAQLDLTLNYSIVVVVRWDAIKESMHELVFRQFFNVRGVINRGRENRDTVQNTKVS